MVHQLSSIRIINFKSIIDCEFKLSAYTPLVGYNNAGKSNIIHAIKWLLEKWSLAIDDFRDPNLPVEVIGTITGITDEILLTLDPKHKKQIEKYIQNNKLTIRRFQQVPNAKVADIKLHVKTIEPKDDEEEWNLNPAGIDNAIKIIFPEPIHIGAMENAEEDVSKSKATSTIGKLLSRIIQPIEESYGDRIKNQLKAISTLLDADSRDRAPELDEFDAAMNRKIDVFFQGVNVKVHIPTPELKEVFSKGTLKVFEDGRNGGKDVASLGHGAQRSIQMALIQYLAEVQKNVEDDKSRTLLLIDEPELYLHPQAIEVIREALKILSNGNYQIVFSTHSAILITEKEMPSTILVRKSISDGTHKKPTLHEAVLQVIDDRPYQKRLLFSLTNSSNILFSEKVILAEGATEQRLLPIIFESIIGSSLGINKLALVSQEGGGSTKKSMEILDVMGLPNKAIVDLDYVFKTAIGNLLDANDSDCIACKNIMSSLASANGISIGSDGWPTSKNSSMPVTEAFSLLAKDSIAIEHIRLLHDKLKAKRIWLWKNGTIEKHLGLSAKNDQVWSDFAQDLKDKSPEEVIHDYFSVKACIDWLIE